jgi:hypothetical protein
MPTSDAADSFKAAHSQRFGSHLKLLLVTDNALCAWHFHHVTVSGTDIE